MKRFTNLFVTFCGTAALAVIASADPSRNADPTAELRKILQHVPVAELPAKAAEIVAAASASQREAVARNVIRVTATQHPGSLPEVVGAISSAVPAAAAASAAEATRLAPEEAQSILNAASSAAPPFAPQITRAVEQKNSASPNPNRPSKPPQDFDNGNRPAVPPGLEGTTKPGLIRGDRPSIPPGHVRDPKPGRDPQRRRYGAP